MKHFLVLIALVVTCLPAHSQDSKTHFKQLLAIEGTWSMPTKRGTMYETWLKANDSTLIGKTYKLMNADTILLETIQLVIKGKDIFYMPTVQGQNNGQPVQFKLSKVENETFTFDNPQHDFPQLVVYQLPKNGTMRAWVEGMDKGSYRKSDFVYKKIK